MEQRSSPQRVHISGQLALFTRPEMKVERVSYEVMTPSAARGILEAILWKPQMRWLIDRITVLKPIRFMAVKRNEVASKVPSTAASWARQGRPAADFFADDDRQQRNAIVLRDVAYVVEARIELTTRAESGDSCRKYEEMFTRRLRKGQRFQQPYLGCREFAAEVRPATAADKPDPELLGHERLLGWMLNDLVYEGAAPVRPCFFEAVMKDGVIEVPPLERGATA